MRKDLAYRLNVVSLRVPSLRERGDDIVALTLHLAARHAAILGRAEPHISEEAMYRIRNYPCRATSGNWRTRWRALVAMSQRG